MQHCQPHLKVLERNPQVVQSQDVEGCNIEKHAARRGRRERLVDTCETPCAWKPPSMVGTALRGYVGFHVLHPADKT